MFRPVTNITITQRPNTDMPGRTRVISLDFLNYYSWQSTWTRQTDNGKIVIPRNLYYRDETNKLNPLNGTRVNIGGFTAGADPLFMRGDRVVIESGYKYDDPSILRTVNDTKIIATGYISKVYAKTPIEFDIEDNMWLLKQTPMPGRTFTVTDKLEDVVGYIIETVNDVHGVSLTHNTLTDTPAGTIIEVGNETASQLLDRIKRLYGFNAYFRGDELRCGIFNYIPSDASTHIFIMNGQRGNVPAQGQELEYQRKEDLSLSAVAYSTITADAGGTTKDGHSKKKKQRIEVLVEYRNGKMSGKEITTGSVPAATEGERRTFFFPEATTAARLIELAQAQLLKYYYTGLRGKFTAFGIPYVRHGDNVTIKNPLQPEYDGTYKVRGVEYTGGMEGLRQIIELDYKV